MNGINLPSNSGTVPKYGNNPKKSRFHSGRN
jgi:hypothetical protein